MGTVLTNIVIICITLQITTAQHKLLTLYSQVHSRFAHFLLHGGEVICWFSAWLHMHVSNYHGYMCDLLVLNVQIIACILWSPTSLVPGFNNS